MRGRLINPFSVGIVQVDLEATHAAGDYDDVFREPKVVASDDEEGVGTDALALGPVVYVQAQIEMGTYEKLRMRGNGNSPEARVTIVLHFSWLEENGYVDADTGTATIPKVGDRLVSIVPPDGGVGQVFAQPLYCVEAMPTGFGFGRSRNLLVASFDARDKGPR